MAYWNYRTTQGFDKSYGFEDPIYRKEVSLVQYIKRLASDPVRLRGVKIKGVHKKDAVARVDLITRVTVRVRGAPPLTVNIDRKDRWGRIEGIWYHVNDEHFPQSHGRN